MSFKYKELGECIDLIIDNRGKTPKKMGSDWVEKGIKTISAKNVHNGKLDNYESIRFVNSEVYKKWMKDDIKKGDCLLVSEGATLGENLYWDLDEKVVIGQRLYCIRTNEEILNSKYFSAYLNTVEYQKEIEGRSTGTSVLGIRQTELLKTKVLIMDMEEQKFIGNLYYDINLKIEVNNKINKNLEEMAQAIFKQWFVDFEFPNEEGKPYKSSGGEMVESELGMIPKGWKIFKLGDFIKFIKGKKPKKIEEKFFDGCELYLTIDVLNRNSEIFANKDKIIEVNDDDILMVMDGASSGSLYYGLNGILGSTLAKISVLNTIDKSFLYYYLKLNESSIKSHLTGSAIPHTDKEFINKLCLAIPNDEMILKKADTILNNIRNHTINLNTECSKIKKVRDTLLPKLMSGEIRVPLENSEN